uniref:Uncharacterized protein n=1 Tax=Bactrocera latifrons TaxID=174628 RepID=A0A0K8UGN3_BACLA
MKILNSTAINLPSKPSDSIPADTIINIKIDQSASALDLPLDTEGNFESEAAGEDVSIEAEEEGEYDFIQIENYISENSVELESDNIFNQQKCDELSKELQDKDVKYVKKTEELLARIRELEKELGQSKEELKKKTTSLSRTEIELDKATTAYQNLLENYEELENKYKNELEINKNTSMENKRLQQEKARLSEKCMEYEKQKKLKQKESVTTSQAPSSSIGKEIAIGNRRYSGGHNNMQNTPSKAQLFNGIKKYISSSMLALLRMEMFGGADREWKPDEQRVAMDLLQLGDEVYKYINDEWRFRLPALGEVRAWLADTINSIDDEEDL